VLFHLVFATEAHKTIPNSVVLWHAEYFETKDMRMPQKQPQSQGPSGTLLHSCLLPLVFPKTSHRNQNSFFLRQAIETKTPFPQRKS
jgi:hypothetical protein